MDKLLGDEKKTNVSFGTTTDRQCFPTQVPPTRFGNELNPITGAPIRGPGRYDVDEITNLVTVMDTKPQSNRGYTLGSRTERRFREHIDMMTPDPAAYQPNLTRLCDSGQAYRPFNSGTRRDQSTRPNVESIAPGPGLYDITESVTNRRVSYHQSFGGRPIGLPDVTQHSTIEPNTSKLRSTRDEKLYQRRLAYLKLHYN